MFFIDSETKNIKLTQGNSAEIDTTPYILGSTEPLILQDGEKVVFTVRSKYLGKIIIQKIATNLNYDENNNLTIKLKPEDTNIPPYKYIYDVFYISQSGDIYTYIDCSEFEIIQAVGLKTDLG